MSLFRLASMPAAAMLLAPLLCATPSVPECQSATLAQYEALQNGCIIGTNPTFTFKDFTFGILSASAGESSREPASALAASVNVTPIFNPERELSLSFSSPLFSVGSGQSVQYLIAYTEDPPPPEIIRFGLEMHTDPPVFPGVAQITTDVCVYAAFDGSNCPGQQYSLSVFDNGRSSSLSDLTPDFSPVAVVLGVRDIISLNGGTTGSASFSSFEGGSSIVGIPEPATVLLFAAALPLLLISRRVRAKSR